MTTQPSEREARARAALAKAIRDQGDSAQSAAGIEAGKDHAVWAHVAIRAALAFADRERAEEREAAATTPMEAAASWPAWPFASNAWKRGWLQAHEYLGRFDLNPESLREAIAYDPDAIRNRKDER